MKLSDVDEAAETTIAQNVSMVSGVAQVQVLWRAEIRHAGAARSERAGLTPDRDR